MECPSKECHDKVDGHQKTLYGENGRSGMVADMEKKVEQSCLRKYMPRPSTAFLIVLFTVVIIPTLLTGIKVWSQQETSEYKYADAKKVQNHEERLLVQEQAVINIEEDVDEIKESIKEQNKEMKEEFKDIKKMIREIPHQ